MRFTYVPLLCMRRMFGRQFYIGVYALYYATSSQVQCFSNVNPDWPSRLGCVITLCYV